MFFSEPANVQNIKLDQQTDFDSVNNRLSDFILMICMPLALIYAAIRHLRYGLNKRSAIIFICSGFLLTLVSIFLVVISVAVTFTEPSHDVVTNFIYHILVAATCFISGLVFWTGIAMHRHNSDKAITPDLFE